MSTQTEMARLSVEEPVLPVWARQPQNLAYWRAVYRESAIRKKREEIGECFPPLYHDGEPLY